MDFVCNTDLWEHLAASDKTIVLYGMGNGADKILRACAEKGIPVSGVFASDGFVRGHLFHGMPVCTWSEIKARYGAQNVIVLLSFGTSREEVLENIYRIAAESEFYAPDVPAFGDGLFDRSFFEAHQDEIDAAYELLSDEESKRIYQNVLRYKLTGNISHLQSAESNPDTVRKDLVRPADLHAVADLGAYNGDTVRELLEHANGNLHTVYALEPDPRNYRKLESYAATEARAKVIPLPVGAWDKEETLFFDISGNRNASFESSRSQSLKERSIKQRAVTAAPLDSLLSGARVDYIKYDVEGAERQALIGSAQTIRVFSPTLLVSLYHRNEDLFALPLLIHSLFPNYRHFYLRRFRGIPAWDLNLYVK